MKKHKFKFKRIFLWFIINSAIAVLGILGLVYAITYAKNIFFFTIWVVTIMYIIGLCVEDIRTEIRKKGRSVPAWLAVTYDIGIILLLAAFSHFLLATLWVIQAICEAAIFTQKRNKK